MNSWSDHYYFMKHVLDRLSYIDHMYAGGQGRAEAVAELSRDVEAEVNGARLRGEIAAQSRLLYFLEFLKRNEAVNHPETGR